MEEKKQKKGLFGKRNKQKKPEDFSEDMYYGLQLKAVNQIDPDHPLSKESNSYADLFDGGEADRNSEAEQNYARIQDARRRQLEQAVKASGMDADKIADEFGVVAAMPITAYSGDAYAAQFGVDAESEPKEAVHSGAESFTHAMLDNVKATTGEINTALLQKQLQQSADEKDTSVGASAASAISFETSSFSLPEAVLKEMQPQLMDIKPEVPDKTPVSEHTGSFTAVDLENSRRFTESIAGFRKEAYPEDAPFAENESDVLTPVMAANVPAACDYGSDSDTHYATRESNGQVIQEDLLASALQSEMRMYEQKPAAQDSHGAGFLQSMLKKKAGHSAQNAADEQTEQPDDFTDWQQVPAIRKELQDTLRSLGKRTVLTAVCTVLSFAFTVWNELPAVRGKEGYSPVLYILSSVLFLGAALLINRKTVFSGLKPLFRQPNADSPLAIAGILGLLSLVLSLIFPAAVTAGNVCLYGCVLSFGLLLNVIGKLCAQRRIQANFRYLTASKEKKYAIKLWEDANSAVKMARDCVVSKPVIAYRQRAGFFKRFLQLSYAEDPSETTSSSFTVVSLLTALILFALCLLLRHGPFVALGAAEAALCAGLPIANTLCMNRPLVSLCARSRKEGGMLCSYETVDQLGDVNAVTVDATELFPEGTVTMCGIQALEPILPLSDAVLCASVAMKYAGGPLKSVFSQIMQKYEQTIPEIEDPLYEQGNGVCAKFGRHTVLVGNRTLLLNHHVMPPEREMEAVNTTDGKFPVYLAIDDKPCAMFTVQYAAEESLLTEIQRLSRHGVSLLVRSNDANITPQMIGRLFGIDASTVSVLPVSLSDTVQQTADKEISRTDALAVTHGAFLTTLRLLSRCISTKEQFRFLPLLQTVCSVLGLIFAAAFACFGGIGRLSATGILLYQILCAGALLLLPRFAKK